MSTALQVLGVIFLVLLALAIIGYILIRIFFWRVGRQLKDAIGSAVATPHRITLVPNDELEWAHEANIERYAAPLAGVGFEDAGLWTAEEMPGLGIAAYVHPSEHVTAVVYEHPAGLVVLDLVTRYADGDSVTYTTTDLTQAFDERPGHPKVADPDAETTVLFRRMVDERPGGEILPAIAEEFKQVFEQAYADEMDWRLSRGGATEEEIRRIAEASGEEYSDEVIAETLQMQQWEAMAHLEDALHEQFARETTMSVAEWERASDHLFFVHDRLDSDSLRELSDDWTSGDAEDHQWPEELTPREQFAAAIEELEAGDRPEKIGTVSGPAPADAYVPGAAWFEDDDEQW